jgi:mRNA interferase MazF
MKAMTSCEVALNAEDGLPKPCVINLDTITTIAKTSLRDKLTGLSPEKLRAVTIALKFALGLER